MCVCDTKSKNALNEIGNANNSALTTTTTNQMSEQMTEQRAEKDTHKNNQRTIYKRTRGERASAHTHLNPKKRAAKAMSKCNLFFDPNYYLS